MLSTSVIGLLLMSIGPTGCTATQGKAWERALRDVAQTQEVQKILADSVIWLGEQYVSIDTISRIDIREETGKDEFGYPIRKGPIIGSVHLSEVKVSRWDDAQALVEMKGRGYIGHSLAQNATFDLNVAMIMNTKVDLFDDENYARIDFTLAEIIRADLTIMKLTRLKGPLVRFILKRIDWAVALRTGGLIQNFGTVAGEFVATEIAEHFGGMALRTALRRGLTLAFDRSERARHWVGVGIADPGLPQEPYQLLDGERKVLIAQVRLWKNGRLFVGPIKMQKGQSLQVTADVDPERYPWGLDYYIADDLVARMELDSYLDERYSDADRIPLASGTGSSWRYTHETTVDTIVWFVLDFTNVGHAQMPWWGTTDATVKLALS